MMVTMMVCLFGDDNGDDDVDDDGADDDGDDDIMMMVTTTIHLCLAGIAKRTQCCGTECHDMVERGKTCNDDNCLNQSGCGSAGGADIADEDDDDDAAGECA